MQIYINPCVIFSWILVWNICFGACARPQDSGSTRHNTAVSSSSHSRRLTRPENKAQSDFYLRLFHYDTREKHRNRTEELWKQIREICRMVFENFFRTSLQNWGTKTHGTTEKTTIVTAAESMLLENKVVFQSCGTPTREPGICLKIKNCPPLRNLLVRSKDSPAIKEFLQKSYCGKENGDVVVCCPSTTTTLPPVSSTTQKIVTPKQITSKPSIDLRSRHPLPESLKLSPEEQKQCGKSNVTRTRIVAGNDAELGSWPWIAVLGYPLNNKGIRYLCGGTLITDQHVLTAAHCILDLSIRPVEVRLGDLNLNDSVEDGAYPLIVQIDKYATHEHYQRYPRLVNDIAVITLKTKVQFNKLIRPLCLPVIPALRTSNFRRKLFYIVGWGSTVYGNTSQPEMLQEAQVPSYDDDKCKESYKDVSNTLIDEKVICAGGNGRDTCQGDSGGPLMAIHESTFYLIGIVSYGQECGDPDHPGVYTKVPYFLDWIFKHIGSSGDCAGQQEICTNPQKLIEPRSRT